MRLCRRLQFAGLLAAAVGGTAAAQVPAPPTALPPGDPVQFQPVPAKPPADAPLPPPAFTDAPRPVGVPGAVTGTVPVPSPALVAPPPGGPIKGTPTVECGASPALAVKQALPDTVSPGQAVTAEVSVTNTGLKTAENVVLAGWWTQGYELADTSVQAQAVNGRKAWGLGAIPAGETRVLKVKLNPQPGITTVEFRSGFDATCSNTTDTKSVKVVKPELACVVEGSEVAFVGQPVTLHLKVRNPSASAVEKVYVKVELPDSLTHPKGQSLESEISTLAAGTSESIPLNLTAVKGGEGRVRVKVSAAGCDAFIHEVKVVAMEARMSVTLSGPKNTYQNWPVTYEAVIENQGDQVMKGATFEVKLPVGLSDLRASDKPGYDAAGHRLVWKMDTLSPGEKRTVFWFGFAKQAEDLATVGTATVSGTPLKRAEWTTKNLGTEGR